MLQSSIINLMGITYQETVSSTLKRARLNHLKLVNMMKVVTFTLNGVNPGHLKSITQISILTFIRMRQLTITFQCFGTIIQIKISTLMHGEVSVDILTYYITEF